MIISVVHACRLFILTQVSLQSVDDDEPGLKEHPRTHSCVCILFIHTKNEITQLTM